MSHPITEQIVAMRRLRRLRRSTDALLFVFVVAAGVSAILGDAVSGMTGDREPIGLIILCASACAWALIVMLVWAAVIVAPLVEPLLTVLAVGLALVVIILGIGTSG